MRNLNMMNLTSIHYLHEIGSKKNQEDYIWPAEGTATLQDRIFIVCDGVGGSENGEIASRIIAEFVGQRLLHTPAENISLTYINELLSEAKQHLINHANSAGLSKDMATTFSLLALFTNKAFIAWCGDSRVYHVRNGDILYKTADHSLVNTLVKNGEITEEEAIVHPQKHIILKAINGDDTAADADGVWTDNLADGDYFLLCTDGLLERITDADLKKLLDRQDTRKDIVQAMQERCAGKTRDNYSMYLLQVNLTEGPAVQKTKSGSWMLWLILITVILAVSGWFILKKGNYYQETAPAVNADTMIIEPAPASIPVRKDTILQPGKDSLPYAETGNRNEAGEKKITPAPLPETKPVIDSPGQKKSMIKKATDTARSGRQTLLKKKQGAEKKDSSLNQGKQLN